MRPYTFFSHSPALYGPAPVWGPPFLITGRSPAPAPPHPTPRTHPTIPFAARSFFVPSRDDLARDELEAVRASDGEDEYEDKDEDATFQVEEDLEEDLEEEDLEEEASLRAWMRHQQEEARKRWGVKGDVRDLVEYRRQQVLR